MNGPIFKFLIPIDREKNLLQNNTKNIWKVIGPLLSEGLCLFNFNYGCSPGGREGFVTREGIFSSAGRKVGNGNRKQKKWGMGRKRRGTEGDPAGIPPLVINLNFYFKINLII
jgi:hypothetical protein